MPDGATPAGAVPREGGVGFVEIGPPNERQGKYVRTVLEVWWCGDEVCDCRQVQVLRRYRNRLAPGAFCSVLVWEGTYFSEGEGGEQIEAELQRAQRDMAERFPNETLTFG